MYEHLHVDITPASLAKIHDALERVGFAESEIEIHNFISECRARVQHAKLGMPDTVVEVARQAEIADDWMES